jgi:tetratricopeptide (TPR) repeat protein
MQSCPLCLTAVEPALVDCSACGEPLAAWRTQLVAAQQIRQRGLRQAAAGDYLGATLSFLESALANPLTSEAWLDASRGLAHLGRFETAGRWLELLRKRVPQSGAEVLLAGLQECQQRFPSVAEGNPDAAGNIAEVATPPAAAPTLLLRQEPAVAADQSSASAAPSDTPVASPRLLLGLPPLLRKRSWLQKRVVSENDPLWTAILSAEGEAPQEFLGETGWWARLMQRQPSHSAILYWLGLSAWQRWETASAIGWFLQSLERGAPVLNPIGYVLLGSADDAAALQQCRDQLLRLGAHREELVQVVQMLQRAQAAIEQQATRIDWRAIEQLMAT